MTRLLFLLLALLPFFASAQSDLAVQEDMRAYSRGNYPSFQVDIPQAKLKDTEKDWLKYLKIAAKGKPALLGGEVVMFGAVNRNVSADTFNVYSKLLETQTSVKLTVWLIVNDTAYISKSLNADQDIAATKYVRDFAVLEYREAVKNELKQEKNKLERLQKDYSKLVKQDEKANNKISENQRAIQRNNTAMETNEQDQRRKTDEITNQETVVSSSKSVSDDSYKASVKVLKELKSDRKKLIKQYEKMGKQIDKWNTQIRDMGDVIDQSRKAQQPKIDEVDAQKAVVKGVEMKLAAIK